jgi:hypothetical protein
VEEKNKSNKGKKQYQNQSLDSIHPTKSTITKVIKKVCQRLLEPHWSNLLKEFISNKSISSKEFENYLSVIDIDELKN